MTTGEQAIRQYLLKYWCEGYVSSVMNCVNFIASNDDIAKEFAQVLWNRIEKYSKGGWDNIKFSKLVYFGTSGSIEMNWKPK